MKVLKLKLLIFFSICLSKKSNFLKSENDKSVSDLRTYKHLNLYLSSLEQIIDFSWEYKDELDMIIRFGLFLVNVHLKPFIYDYSLPSKLRSRLKIMLNRNDKTIAVLKIYQNNKESENYSEISTLFQNSESWSMRLEKLKAHKKMLKNYRNKYLYPEWSDYVKYVKNLDDTVPTPEQSDDCLASLAANEYNPISRQCVVPEECYDMLIKGSNFGYPLTHRLLFLQFARFDRRCFIFSISQDDMMRDEFCEAIYSEAQYIAENRFKNVDLIFEQIALCALDGHAEFLHRSWLANLLRNQTPIGYFSFDPIPSFREFSAFDQFFRNQNMTEEEQIWKDQIIHVTAVAAAAVAPALRFLLENSNHTSLYPE